MRLSLLGALVAIAILGGCSSPDERAQRASEAAREALAQGQREAALAAIGELREIQPDTPEALLELTTLLVWAGEALEAVWLLEAGLRRFPERVDLRLALGSTALLVNDASRARTVVEAIPPDSEHHLTALLTRAQAELQLGNLERALTILKEAERRYPDRPHARLSRIATLLRERRYEEARALLEQTKQSSELVEGRATIRRLEVALHGIEAAQGQTDSAIAGLQALVNEDPGDVQAWRTLIPTLWRAGRSQEALGLVEAALESHPDQLVLYPMLSSLQAALGRADEAEASLRELVDRAQSPSAYVVLAQLYVARQDEERVLALYDEALDAFPEDAMLRKSHAEALVAFGHLEEARAELARFREVAPGDPNHEYLQARLELAEGNAAGAARSLEELMPRLDHASTQFWLGRALGALGDRAGAERRYWLSSVRQPSDPAPYLAIIASAERRGDWRTIVAGAQQLVRHAPGRFEGWRALIAALTNLGEGEVAEGIARTSLELFPDRPEPRVLFAGALRVQGRHAEALEQLAQAADRFGTTPEIEAEQALTEGMGGRLEEAIAAARRGLVTSPDSARLHLVLAALLFRAGEVDAGTRASERALELDPDDLSPLRIRAEFGAATGRLEEARSDCERYLELRPDDPTVHFVLAVVHEKSGDPEAAIASYRRAAELDQAAFAPRNNLAVLLAALGDLDAALDSAQQAYAIAGDHPHVMDTLGELYLRKGLVDRAISLLEDAHAAAPELPAAQLHLALAYREAGRIEPARVLLADLRSRSQDSELQARVDEALDSLR